MTVWQPGVVGIVGLVPNAPPSMLYSTVKPDTAATLGKLKAEAQVFAGAVIVGAGGKITALVLTGSHAAPSETASAAVLPQAAIST